MGLCSSRSEPTTAIEPTTHLSYHGMLDYRLGISMFWSDKFILLLLHFQRLALLLQWNLKWSQYFTGQLYFLNVFLLDFTAKHDGVKSLTYQHTGVRTFEGCETICKIVWPIICLPILFTWAFIYKHKTLSLYYSRNIERITWTVVRLGLIPFMNTLMRYFILNQNGNLDRPVEEMRIWKTPDSEFGVVLSFITVGLFFYFGFMRSYRTVLFRSHTRHESFLRTRELEYKLRINTMYRNERVWMVSSYFYAGWLWSVVRGLSDIVLLIAVILIPPYHGAIIGCIVFGLEFLYIFFIEVYRCKSTVMIVQVFSFFLFVFTICCLWQSESYDFFLVGRQMDYLLLALIGFPVAVYLVLIIYYFIDSHTIRIFLSVADKRANDKLKNKFGNVSKANRVNVDAVGDNENTHAAFLSSRAISNESEEDSFYFPKPTSLISLNCASSHVWPVNNVLVNEMLLRNEDDHFIDILRGALKLLYRISVIRDITDLFLIDEIKVYVGLLLDSVRYCKRIRITHHIGAVYPLQTIFEDLIEQFMFELRECSSRLLTLKDRKSHRTREVLRYLKLRMEARDKTLSLISPTMRRVLMKLLALRLFIQLIKDRPSFLLPMEKEIITPGGNDNSWSNK